MAGAQADFAASFVVDAAARARRGSAVGFLVVVGAALVGLGADPVLVLDELGLGRRG